MIILALAAIFGTSDNCRAIDGDTLVCLVGKRRVHLRLNGIDSPELAGHCRAGRKCAPGDPIAAKAFMATAIDGKRIRWTDLGRDRYGRVIASARVAGSDLSCAQLRSKNAIFKPKWDNKHQTAKACPAVVRVAAKG